jgi:chromate transporter
LAGGISMNDDGETMSGARHDVRFSEAIRLWARIGVLSFGGPAAQIALMHREIVDERGWLSEQEYLNALSFCMLLPGPEAMQLATYAGWRLHGTLGGLAAGLLFVLPGAVVILVLAAIYVAFGDVSFLKATFFGIKAAVVVIVIEALIRVSKRALGRLEYWLIAGLAFIAIFFLALPYPLIVLAAALFGFWRGGVGTANSSGDAKAPVRMVHSFRRSVRTVLTWLAIWWLPLGAVALIAPDTLLPQIGLFFSKLSVVTFGGAYAVLAYMGQDVVTQFGWLNAGEMMDGLGLAETTPGPLILVTEFVGFIAAYRDGGFALALAGALITLWVTFVPCFLWIFVGAPYIDWISNQPRLKAALTAITAAVVGVILNLSVWFSLHVFFANVDKVEAGPLVVWMPHWLSLDWRAVVLTALCAVLMLKLHWSIVRVLILSAISGAGLFYLPGL